MPSLPLVAGSRAATAAAVLALAAGGVYLAVVSGQDAGVGSRIGFVAGSLAAAATAAFGASALAPGPRAGLLAWSTATLVAWTLLGIASIGLLVAPAAAFALAATQKALTAGGPGARPAALVGSVLAVLVVAAGLAWTS